MSTHPPADELGDLGDAVYDPLVPPPYGLSPWWERLTGLLRRSGKPVVLILLLTIAAPQVAQAAFVAVVSDGAVLVGPGFAVPEENGTADLSLAAFTDGSYLSFLAAYVVITLVAAVGWAAAIWAVTAAAAGVPVDIAVALRAGARRLLPMFGWYVLYTMAILVGLFLYAVPGLYLMLVGSLFSFVVMYERGRNPMVRSFRLVHRAFLAVLGRLALLLLFVIMVFCTLGVLLGTIGLAGTAESLGARMAGDVVTSLAVAPVYTVLLMGLLLTYAQARGRQEPISTGELWAAVDDEPTG